MIQKKKEMEAKYNQEKKEQEKKNLIESQQKIQEKIS